MRAVFTRREFRIQFQYYVWRWKEIGVVEISEKMCKYVLSYVWDDAGIFLVIFFSTCGEIQGYISMECG